MKKSKTKNQEQDDLPMNVLRLGHISERQITAVMAVLLGTKAFLITPTSVILRVSTAAWMSVLISVALGLVALAGWLKWSHLTQNTPTRTACASLREELQLVSFPTFP